MQGQIPQSTRAGSFGRCGVIAESVPNPTLSGIEEHRARIAEGPEAVLERFGWPNVVAIEGDVLPAERRDMSNKIIGNSLAARTQFVDDATEIDGIPEDYGDTLLNPYSNLSRTRSSLPRSPSWPASPVSSFPACRTM